MKLKWVKGHNGQRRKLARAVASMETAYKNGATFDELWEIYEPVELMATGFTLRKEYGAELAERAGEMLQVAGENDEYDDLMGWYWRNQGVLSGL